MPSLSFSGQLSGNALLGRSMHGKRLCDWQHRDSGRFHFRDYPNRCCAARRKRCWQGCPLPVQIEIPGFGMVHGGYELHALSANHLGKLPDHAALWSRGRTSVRVDAAVPHLEALVLLVDRTGKGLEQHRLFLGINALCREHRDEFFGTQFRRIAEVQAMIEILQGIVTAYVISIPGRNRAAGGDGINNSVRVNAEFALRSHYGTCPCAPMDHQMNLILKISFSLGE